MNNRERAAEILRRTRELLAERLTECVLAAEEGLLDDARGESFWGDIERIYEQFGSKLAHLNSLLNNLPQETTNSWTTSDFASASSASDGRATSYSPVKSEVILPLPPAISGPLIVSPPALPAPRMAERDVEVEMASLKLFIAQAFAGDINSAGQTLAVLCEVSHERGRRSAEYFLTRWHDDATLIHRLLQLRQELQQERFSPALALLEDCFGFGGAEGLAVIQSLYQRLLASE